MIKIRRRIGNFYKRFENILHCWRHEYSWRKFEYLTWTGMTQFVMLTDWMSSSSSMMKIYIHDSNACRFHDRIFINFISTALQFTLMSNQNCHWSHMTHAHALTHNTHTFKFLHPTNKNNSKRRVTTRKSRSW